MSCKMISPAVLAAFVLSACGGGGSSDAGSAAVSGSPEKSLISTSSTSTTTPPKAAGASSGSTQAQDSPGTTQPPFFASQSLRADALMTMVDAKTPVEGRTVDRVVLDHITPRFLPVELGRVESRNGKITDRKKEDPHPAIQVDSHISPDNYTAIPPDDHLYYYDGRYHPSSGSFTLSVASYASNLEGISHDATLPFPNVKLLLSGYSGKEVFALGNELRLTISSGTAYSGNGTNVASMALTSQGQKSFDPNHVFHANQPIMQWDSGDSHVDLSWKPGPGPRDVDLCWNIQTKYVRRLHCTLWTLQEDWSYGKRFMNGGVYLEDDRSVHPGESGIQRWRVDGRSSSIDHG